MAGGFKRRRGQREEGVRVDLNGMMAPFAGDDGLTESDFEEATARTADVRATLAKRRRAGTLGIADLPAREDVKRVVEAAAQARGRFDDLVVLGVGASAVAARAVWAALVPPAAGGMRIHVADSADPVTLGAVLDRVDLGRTLFDVVSASGETAGSLGQFLVVRERLLKELGALAYKQHVVITTGVGEGTLRQIVNDEGFDDLPLPAAARGAFAVLSAAGLFPAACAGVAIDDLLAGAAEMDHRCHDDDPHTSPALLHASVLQVAVARKGRRAVVLVPYADALAPLADWFTALWGDALGDDGATGAAAGAGVPPVAGLAGRTGWSPLAIAGPTAAVTVFVRVERRAGEIEVPKGYEDLESVSYLGKQGLGALLNGGQHAAELELGRRGHPSATILCPQLSPYVVGQLVRLLTLEVVALAELRGVDLADPHRAPAGLAGSYGLGGRERYEAARAEVQRWAGRKDERYVV
jgi:glucose-6-phosphate isomerase